MKRMTGRRTWPSCRAMLALCAWAIATTAGASYHIESLFSNQNGEFQYIELREDSPDGKATPLAGSIVTVRHGDVVKQYVIPSNPPDAFPAGGSLILSTVADWSSDDFGPVPPMPPDYVVPGRFLPTDGGTIDLDGQNVWTFPPLPRDGSTALLRSGATAPASGSSFALGRFSVHVDFVGIIEYYNADVDQYFLTGSAPDLDAIESQRIKGWVPTGYSLPAYTLPRPIHCCTPPAGLVAVPVCRYYIPPELGDSHFLSAFAEECDAIATRFPAYVLEDRTAFYVYLPEKDTGVCLGGRPIYRLWNQRGGAGHRYIYDDLARRIPLLQQGWIPEGYGPAGVAWCI